MRTLEGEARCYATQSSPLSQHADGSTSIQRSKKSRSSNSSSGTSDKPRTSQSSFVIRCIEKRQSELRELEAIGCLPRTGTKWRNVNSISSREAVCAHLFKLCVRMRQQGVTGSWIYNLPLHRRLAAYYKLEKAEIRLLKMESAR